MPVNSRDVLLLSVVAYHKQDGFQRLLPFATKTSSVSLRLIEYFVTRYCAKHSVSVIVDGATVDVNASYKTHLKAHSKDNFDPFRRNDRVDVVYGHDKDGGRLAVVTTVGQMNFFRWVFKHHVLEYIAANAHRIQAELDSEKRGPDAGRKRGAQTAAKAVVFKTRSHASPASLRFE